jgi:hypothetical protein
MVPISSVRPRMLLCAQTLSLRVIVDSEEQRKEILEDEEKSLSYRKAVETEINVRFRFVCRPRLRRLLFSYALTYRRSKLARLKWKPLLLLKKA